MAGFFLCLFSAFAMAVPVAPWPMDGHDAQRTGCSSYPGPNNPKQLWEASIVDKPENMGIIGTVIGADGTLYVAEDNALHALSPDGKQKWTFTGPISSSPAIGPDGTVYFGSKKLYALNPEGKLQWEFSPATPHGETIQSPVIGKDGVIYLVMDKMYAINPDGKQKWSFCPPDLWGWRPPALGVNSNTVYAVGSDTLYAINSKGTQIWSTRGESRATKGYKSAPCVGVYDENDIVYLSSAFKFPTTCSAVTYDGVENWKLNILGKYSVNPIPSKTYCVHSN
ncbi:MAG: PQQ-binding-like beta-propeller repeat protein, partial [bacterium]